MNILTRVYTKPILVFTALYYGAALPASGYEVEPWVRTLLTARDINHRPGNISIDEQGWLIETRLGVTEEINRDWSWFVDVRALASSDNALLIDQENDILSQDSNRDSYFLQLREAYVQYSGLTDYRDEYLRIGLQRLRDDDGFWWDADIESVAWHGDTTQLDWLFAIGQEFDTYRTDADLFAINDDVLRSYMRVDWDWIAYNSIGFTHMTQRQSTSLPAARFADTSLGHNASIDTFAIRLMSNWSEREGPQRIAYKLEWIEQSGSAFFVNPLSERTEFSVSSDAIDAGLRVDFDKWSFGLTYTRGSGGIEGNDIANFSQSGLHTNRAKFFGSRQMIMRFNEALRADVTNLTHQSLFATWRPFDNLEAVFQVGNFEKTNQREDIFSVGRRIATYQGVTDIGTSADINVSYYPKEGHPYNLSLLRARMGYFNTGAALVNPDNDYQVMIDAMFVF